MARPLRIEFAGAVYHVTSRGDRREDIFSDGQDRKAFLAILAHAMSRFDAVVLAYCLMDNHYHLVIQTRKANLSALMRQINGVYTQSYNRRHRQVGHLLQGRFKAILVDRDAYLLEVCRYVELNPVRAKIVRQPGQWAWSSYRAHVGRVNPAEWLDSQALYGHILSRAPRGAADRKKAAQRYAEFVSQGKGVNLWVEGALRQQIYLGDAQFVEQIQALDEKKIKTGRNVPKAQRAKPLTLAQWLKRSASREEAFMRAHIDSGISMTDIASAVGLSASYVGRLIRKVEGKVRSRT